MCPNGKNNRAESIQCTYRTSKDAYLTDILSALRKLVFADADDEAAGQRPLHQVLYTTAISGGILEEVQGCVRRHLILK